MSYRGLPDRECCVESCSERHHYGSNRCLYHMKENERQVSAAYSREYYLKTKRLRRYSQERKCCVEGCTDERHHRSNYCLAHRNEDKKNNPGKYLLRYNLIQRFGIDHLDYENLWKKQNGVCAICRQTETATIKGAVRRLAVDHSHETDAIRGLLCVRCNTILAAANDDIDLLLASVQYLNSPPTGLVVTGTQAKEKPKIKRKGWTKPRTNKPYNLLIQ
jgi:hypothetical protein